MPVSLVSRDGPAKSSTLTLPPLLESSEVADGVADGALLLLPRLRRPAPSLPSDSLPMSMRSIIGFFGRPARVRFRELVSSSSSASILCARRDDVSITVARPVSSTCQLTLSHCSSDWPSSYMTALRARREPSVISSCSTRLICSMR